MTFTEMRGWMGALWPVIALIVIIAWGLRVDWEMAALNERFNGHIMRLNRLEEGRENNLKMDERQRAIIDTMQKSGESLSQIARKLEGLEMKLTGPRGERGEKGVQGTRGERGERGERGYNRPRYRLEEMEEEERKRDMEGREQSPENGWGEENDRK